SRSVRGLQARAEGGINSTTPPSLVTLRPWYALVTNPDPYFKRDTCRSRDRLPQVAAPRRAHPQTHRRALYFFALGSARLAQDRTNRPRRNEPRRRAGTLDACSPTA